MSIRDTEQQKDALKKMNYTHKFFFLQKKINNLKRNNKDLTHMTNSL